MRMFMFYEKTPGIEGTSLKEFVSWEELNGYLMRKHPYTNKVSMSLTRHKTIGQAYEVRCDSSIVGWIG